MIKVYTLRMDPHTLNLMRKYCIDNDCGMGDMIRQMLADWIADFFPMDVMAYRSIELKRGYRDGSGRDTVKFTAKLPVDLVEIFNETRVSRQNDDLPFGDAVSGIWAEWEARYGRDFEPTPRKTVKGMKFPGKKRINPNDPEGKYRQIGKNYNDEEKNIRAARLHRHQIERFDIDNGSAIGWFSAFALSGQRMTVKQLYRFCRIQGEVYGKQKLPGEFLVWCVTHDHDPANVQLFSEWKLIHGSDSSPEVDPLYWASKDTHIPIDHRDDFIRYCEDHGIIEITSRDYVEWATIYQLSP